MEQSSNPESKMYKCDKCGGIMVFDIKSQQVKCPNCGNTAVVNNDKPIVEYSFDTENIKKASIDWNNATHVLQCESCGAEVTVPRDVTSTECSFCGSSHVLEIKQESGIRPEGILPFKIDKLSANQIFTTWVKGRFFAPNALKTIAQQDKLNAVYLPFWTYDASTSSFYQGYGGEVYYVQVGEGQNRHTETRVRWYPVSGNLDVPFDDVLVDASSQQNPLIGKVDNFNTQALTPFDSIYLSGFIAQKYMVEPDQAFLTAKGIMNSRISNEAERQILSRYDQARVTDIKTSYSNVTFKHVLLPVWISGYMFRGKRYEVAINGANGQITGEYPISAVKIGIIVILCIIIVIIIYSYYEGSGNSYYYSMGVDLYGFIR